MTTNAPLARRSSETRLSNEDKSYLIDRSAEATRLALVIGEATTRFVVLHGQPASGKSVLVTKWLLPALRDSRRLGGRRVYFASCTSVIPEAVGDDQSKTSLDEALVQPAIIVMDRFDRVLESPREDRKRQLDTLFAAMSRPTSIATLVVIVDTRQLTSVYSLTAYNPAMASAIEAIRGVGFTEGLTRLGTAGRGGGPVRYTSDALSKLEDEAKQLRLDSTFDFLKLVHARFRALLADMGAEEVDVAHYVAVGGLEGILRDHLDQCIDNAESSQAGTGVVARAALLCVHEVVSRGTTLDIVGLARRYEVSETAVRDVFALLAEPDGPVIGSADAPLGLQPPQLSSILEADRAALQAKNERARRVIEEALRSWRALGTPIPPNRFAEINGQRHELVLDAELARFLAQCALRMQDPELAAFAPYWLSRVASDDDAADILLAALFESDARVRERAARALAPRADARVRDRLCVLALGDDSASVRAAAVESLAWMADEPLLEHLRSEAANVKSPNRANAVHALRIFARPDVTDVLRRLVADCETPLAVRREAVEALGAIGTAASVDALVDIALDDADADDRDAAADALAAVATSELDRRILERLRWPRPIGRIIGVGVFLALVLVIGIAFALVFAGSAAESDQIGWVFLGMIALTVGTGILVRRVASGRIRRRSAAGLLSLALFTTCTVAVIPFFHGLAHFMVKRRQRALLLFFVELSGIALMGLAFSIQGLGIVWVGYLSVAIAVFAASYLYDTLVVMLETFILAGPLTRESRRSAILRRALGNSVMTATVLEDAGSADAGGRRRARSLIRRYGQHMAASVMVDRLPVTTGRLGGPSADALSRAKDDAAVARLAELWPASAPPTRRLIERVLERRPTERAVATLSRLAQGEGLFLKARAWIAGVRYRLGLWPLSTRLAALALLPAFAILIYHGVQIVRNPEWGMILRLRQPIGQEDAKAKIVDLLVDQFPETAEPEMRRLFVEGRRREIGPVHAAVTRGVVSLANRGIIVRGDTVLDAVAADMPRFTGLLYGTDSASLRLGASVLGAMAGSSDTGVANQALRVLLAAADSDATVTVNASDRLEILAAVVGQLDYDRALPVLSRMFQRLSGKKAQSPSDAKTAQLVRMTMSEVAHRTYSKLPRDSAIEDKIRLRDALRRWLPDAGGSRLVGLLDAEIRDSSQPCPAPAACDALRRIARRPESEDAYRDLLVYYAADSQFVRAESAFVALSASHPESVWPRKILSEVEHENLAAINPAYFRKSYDNALIVRRVPAYRDMVARRDSSSRRIETDIAEVALSAGAYEDLQRVAGAILGSRPSATERLNMTLFVYFASVFAHQSDSAAVRLARLDAVVDSLPSGFNNLWEYPGTRAFIQRSDLPPALRKGLLDLCREGPWYARADAKAVIQENRQALATLR